MKLEQLLNSLLERGWKPRGKDQKFGIWIEISPYKKLRLCLKRPVYDYYVYSYRDLVSKESGLWQFCCKNGLTNRDEKSDWSKNAERDEDGVIDRDCLIFSSDYEYRLIESALKSESELEQFLLDNIKI